MGLSWLRVFGAVTLGLFSVAFSWYFLETRIGGTSLHLTNSQPPWGSIMQIENPKGVVLRREGELRSLEVDSPGAELVGDQWVSTGPASSLVILFLNGGPQLELGPLGQLGIRVKGLSRPRLTWTSGELTVRAPASTPEASPELWRDGRQIPFDRLTLAAQRWAPFVGDIKTQPDDAGLIRYQSGNETTPLVRVAGDREDETTREAADGSEATQPLSVVEPAAEDRLGNRSSTELEQRIQAQSRQIQACYVGFRTRRARTASQRDLATGEIELNLEIAAAGRVERVEIKRSDFKEATLHRCVADVIKRTQFRGLDTSSASTTHTHLIRLGR
jgi:hypothetical protein